MVTKLDVDKPASTRLKRVRRRRFILVPRRIARQIEDADDLRVLRERLDGPTRDVIPWEQAKRELGW